MAIPRGSKYDGEFYIERGDDVVIVHANTATDRPSFNETFSAARAACYAGEKWRESRVIDTPKPKTPKPDLNAEPIMSLRDRKKLLKRKRSR